MHHIDKAMEMITEIALKPIAMIPKFSDLKND